MAEILMQFLVIVLLNLLANGFDFQTISVSIKTDDRKCQVVIDIWR